MTCNFGRLDQFVGLALVAYTVKDGTLALGYLVAGVIGLVLLVLPALHPARGIDLQIAPPDSA